MCGASSTRAAPAGEMRAERSEPARLPPVTLVRQHDTHRLIPSHHSKESVLARIAADDEHLRAIFELDGATNDRLLAEYRRLPGIGVEELVFGLPWSHVVNASFCHAHPLGGRFNSPDRGAWYSAFALETAQAEIAFHKSVELAEAGWTDESITYDDYLADFSAEFHDLRRASAWRASGTERTVEAVSECSEPKRAAGGNRRKAPAASAKKCLDPDSYVASQTLGEMLLDEGSLGVVYPSARDKGGTCVACFRPSLVMNVRRDATYRFEWRGGLFHHAVHAKPVRE